ncbi:MAG: ABC transporter ATP-binding protein [Chloroflexi bacterium]|nr:ABC transporter ATP-binding protein [Chloroflexota bacterium]
MADEAQRTAGGSIDFRNVVKVFEGRERIVAVDDVSLRVEPGAFVSVIGPSGCGKSTALNIAAGLLSPTGGEVLLNGRPVLGPGADRGMVFQQYANLPWKTVIENVELGPKIRGVPRRERREIAQHFIAMVGLGGFEGRYPRELSGGMQQRVAIARVLANDPAVILLDEPFGALDAQTREILQEEVIAIWSATKKTIMHVTHSIEEALFLADRVVVMTARPGRVKEVVEIDLPRPRYGLSGEARLRYVELTDQIRHLVREEVLKTLRREVAPARAAL